MLKAEPERIAVKVKTSPAYEGLPLPGYASETAAGLDLLACLAPDEELVLPPGERVLVPTGLFVEMPPDCEAQVRPRSGLALKHGLTMLNSPGTIDADYRGEIGVILINLGQEPFVVRRGMRIAQLIFARYLRAEWQVVAELSETERGEGGFGHTNV